MEYRSRSNSVNQLLDRALEAHGGLQRWRHVEKVKLAMTVGGLLFLMKGKRHAVGKEFTAETYTKEQKTIITPFANKAGYTGVFTRQQVRIKEHEEIISEAGDQTHLRGWLRSLLPWNDLGLLYFSGYAINHYFTLPFSLADEAIDLEEVPSIKIGEEHCQGLRATYPDGFISHSKKEKFYFTPAGRLIRHDYKAEAVSPFAYGAHFSTDYFTVEDFIFPRKRRAYLNFFGIPATLVMHMDVHSGEIHYS